MALFPEFPIEGITEDSQLPSKTYKLDWQNGRIIGIVDNLNAVNQAVTKALLTPRFGCYAYDDQYGSELDKLMRSEGVTREYIRSEAEALLEDALMADSRIDRLEDVNIEFSGDECDIDFTVQTAFGVLQSEVSV